MLKSWMGMNVIGVALYILYLLQVNEDNGKMTSFLVAMCYIMRMFILDDLDISMNGEMNDDIADVQFGISCIY